MGIGSFTPTKKNKTPLISVHARNLRYVVMPKYKTKAIICFRNTSVYWCGE